VRIPAQGKIGEIGQNCTTKLPINRAAHRISAHDLNDLDIEQMRRMEGLSGV